MNDLKLVSTNKEAKRTPWRQVLLTVLGLAVGSLASVSLLHAQAPFDQGPSVNCNASEGDLQRAIDNAPAGSALYVKGSCNDGPFTIRKDIKLLAFDGNDRPTLSAPSGSSVVVNILGASVVFRGINIAAAGVVGGIQLEGASLRAEWIVVEGANRSGIAVARNSWASIENSQTRNNGWGGIHIFGASAARVSRSTSEGNDIGIHVSLSSYVELGENLVSGNRDGIFVTENSSMILLNNTITNNRERGLLVTRNAYVQTVTPANTFTGNLSVDVACFQRGILSFESGPQLPSTGTTTTDGSCILDGPIF